MINSLTKEQESQFSVYSKKWIEIGLSTNPIDMSVMDEIINKLYSQVGLDSPNKIEVYDSPFAAVKAMKEKYDVDVKSQDFVYGAHDAAWLSFFDYLNDVVGVEGCDKLDVFNRLAQNCGWVLFYDELVVLTQRPISIKFDASNVLHCEDDYAVKYSDNTGVAMWHGNRIPKEWIFDKTSSITPDVVLHWRNVEQRRCACEILGWDNVIKLLKPETLDKDGDPTVGTLIEVDLPEIGKERFLLALDPNTNSTVVLPVPPEMKSALEANSWTYGIDKVEFVPDLRV